MDKPQLLLLHGALGATQDFNSLVPMLQPSFEIHSLNFYGHGGIPLPSNTLTINDYVHQILQYLEINKIEKIHLFGYSLGGFAALCFAQKYPQKVQSVLTLATKFAWTPELAQMEIKNLIPERIAEKVPAFANDLIQKHGEENWQKLCLALQHLMVDLVDKSHLEKEFFKNITDLPIQIMVGDSDKMVSKEETQKAAAQIPKSSLAVLPDTGHFLQKVRPKLLYGLLLDFYKISETK